MSLYFEPQIYIQLVISGTMALDELHHLANPTVLQIQKEVHEYQFAYGMQSRETVRNSSCTA